MTPTIHTPLSEFQGDAIDWAYEAWFADCVDVDIIWEEMRANNIRPEVAKEIIRKVKQAHGDFIENRESELSPQE